MLISLVANMVLLLVSRYVRAQKLRRLECGPARNPGEETNMSGMREEVVRSVRGRGRKGGMCRRLQHIAQPRKTGMSSYHAKNMMCVPGTRRRKRRTKTEERRKYLRIVCSGK